MNGKISPLPKLIRSRATHLHSSSRRAGLKESGAGSPTIVMFQWSTSVSAKVWQKAAIKRDAFNVESTCVDIASLASLRLALKQSLGDQWHRTTSFRRRPCQTRRS